jgi:hypothetical protein
MSGLLTALGGMIANATASSSLLYDSYVAGTDTWAFGNGGTNGVLGTQAGQRVFTPSVNTTITKISAYISSTGTVSSRNLYCSIYNVSGTDLGTLVQTSTVVTGSNYGSKTSVDFVFAGASVSSGTDYHIVFHSVQDADLGGFNAYHTNPSLIPGQLDLFNGSGASQNPSTFPTYDLQLQIWGTT